MDAADEGQGVGGVGSRGDEALRAVPAQCPPSARHAEERRDDSRSIYSPTIAVHNEVAIVGRHWLDMQPQPALDYIVAGGERREEWGRGGSPHCRRALHYLD